MHAEETLSAVNTRTGQTVAQARIVHDAYPINPVKDFDQTFQFAICSSYGSSNYTWDKSEDCSSVSMWLMARMRDIGQHPDELYFHEGKFYTDDQMVAMYEAQGEEWDPYGQETLQDLLEWDHNHAEASDHAWRVVQNHFEFFFVKEWGYEYVMTHSTSYALGVMWASHEKIESAGIPSAQKCAEAELHDFSCWANGQTYMTVYNAGDNAHCTCDDAQDEDEDLNVGLDYTVFGLDECIADARLNLPGIARDIQMRTADLHTRILRWLGFGWDLDPVEIRDSSEMKRQRKSVRKWRNIIEVKYSKTLDGKILRFLQLPVA